MTSTLLLLLAACQEKEGSYEPASCTELLDAAAAEDRGRFDPASPVAVTRSRAATALWSAVAEAKSDGLKELYGVEVFQDADEGYIALFFVRTGAGTVCLFADAGLHERRADAGTVPWASVVPAEMDRLRRRIHAQLPLERSVSLTADALGGSIFRLHLFADGESQTLLWFEPLLYPGQSRAALLSFQRAYPGHAIAQALWASAPPAALPKSADDYATRPGRGG